MSNHPAEPLYDLVRRIRTPASYRELMAVCLRHIYIKDPFATTGGGLPPIPSDLIDGISAERIEVAGIQCVLYKRLNEPILGAMLYTHGGGFVVGTSDDTDYVTRKLAHLTGCAVLSVNYSLAPEAPYPQALDECERVLREALAPGGVLLSGSQRVFLAGDSAGGNLAAVLALRLHAGSIPIAGVILLAPWVDMNVEQDPGYNALAPDGIVYDAPFIAYSRACYARFEDWQNQHVSPILGDLSTLPPTILVVGDADPLFEQVMRFHRKAARDGHSRVELVQFPGMPHCFYSLPHLFDEELECFREIAEFVARQVL